MIIIDQFNHEYFHAINLSLCGNADGNTDVFSVFVSSKSNLLWFCPSPSATDYYVFTLAVTQVRNPLSKQYRHLLSTKWKILCWWQCSNFKSLTFKQGKSAPGHGTHRENWRLTWSLKRPPISQGGREGRGEVDSIREIPAEARREIITANQFERRNARQSVRDSEGAHSTGRGETERRGKERCYREKYINTTDCHCICSTAAAQSMISRIALLETRVTRPSSSALC